MLRLQGADQVFESICQRMVDTGVLQSMSAVDIRKAVYSLAVVRVAFEPLLKESSCRQAVCSLQASHKRLGKIFNSLMACFGRNHLPVLIHMYG